MFGCTGWSRRFRLETIGGQKRKLFFVTSLQSNKWWLNKIWEKQDETLCGDIYLRVVGSEDVVKKLLSLIWLISEYGGLGAKAQLGFGQITANLNEKEIKEVFREIKASIAKGLSNNPYWYNLSNFFVLKFKISDDCNVVRYFLGKPMFVKTRTYPSEWNGKYIPCSFDIKYHGRVNNKDIELRYHFKYNRRFGKDLTEALFGFSKGEEKLGSRVFVSHLYKENLQDSFYYLKIWAFLSPLLNSQLNEIKEEIKNHVESLFEECEIVLDEIGESLIRRLAE